MKQSFIRRILAILSIVALLVSAVGCAGPNPNKDITITVWHYYNGPQQSAFDALVTKYNDTVGSKNGVTVVASAQGNVGELTKKVLSAAAGKGSDAVPNIFAAYSDTAFEADKQGLLAPLDSYITADKLAEYIPGYIDEGRFDAAESLKIFPIAKSTELLYLNQTAWEPFAAATGVTYDDLATMEGLVATAAKYYDWSDGKAFFGRDSMANYMFVGAKQLGIDLLAPDSDGNGRANLDPTVMRKLWDNFYLPYLSGHFTHLGKFRNDDMKTGEIIAFVGSTSAEAFLPGQVTGKDGTVQDVTITTLPPPRFADGENYAVQQGAGMVVTKSSDYVEQACVDFLYWLTQPEQNLQFAVDSGYMPVTVAASSDKAFRNYINTEDTSHGLSTALGITESAQMYTPKVFARSNSARTVLENSLIDFCNHARSELDVMTSGNVERTQAIAQLSETANFNLWLNALKGELEAVVN